MVEAATSAAPYTIEVANDSRDYHRDAATLPVVQAWPGSDAGVTNHVTVNYPVILYVKASNGDAVAPGTALTCSGTACAAPDKMKAETPAQAFPSAGLSAGASWEPVSATSTSVKLEVMDSSGAIASKNGTPYSLTISKPDGHAFKSSNGSAFPFTKMALNRSGDTLYDYTYSGQTYYAIVDAHN